MIRIRIDLESAIGAKRSKTLCLAVIANDGSGSQNRGNYTFALSRQGSGKAWKTGKVLGFPRKRKNVWHLLKRCLDEAIAGAA